jgi:hypothetical protein
MKYFFSIFGRLIPVILSFLLLAAHFSRQNETLPVILSVAFTGLLFVRRSWAARWLQGLLFLGAVEWVASMINYITLRKASGDDWIRLAVILTAVALLTALSGLVFFSKRLKEHYRIK